jgi:hypothetical protein
VGAGLLSRVTAAPRGRPTRRVIAARADAPDGKGRDGGPEPVVRGEDAVIPMPVLPRWRDEVGEPVEELLRPCDGLPMAWGRIKRGGVWV